MKSLLLSPVLALTSAPCSAALLPKGYFKLIDLAHPQLSAGALIDPGDLKETLAVTDVAIVTHSNKDGSLIPQSWQSLLPPESWVPLQVGGGGNAGSYIMNIGSSYNFIPVVKNLALKLIDKAAKPESFAGLRRALAPSTNQEFALAAGPSIHWDLMEHGEPLSPVRWRGEFRWFTGAAWKF